MWPGGRAGMTFLTAQHQASASRDRKSVLEQMFRIAGWRARSLHFARDLSESQLEKETTPAGRRRGDRKVSTPRPQGFGARPERAGESVAARRPVLPVTKVWPARAGLGGGMKARWVTPASCKPQRQVAFIFGTGTAAGSFPESLFSGTAGLVWVRARCERRGIKRCCSRHPQERSTFRPFRP